jgi:hypothetical protein
LFIAGAGGPVHERGRGRLEGSEQQHGRNLRSRHKGQVEPSEVLLPVPWYLVLLDQV